MSLCGGDGTLSETANGMIKGGHKTKIGYIPSGTTNDFAYGIGLSSDIMTAADDIVSGTPKAFDAGRFNEREFMYIASFGAFTQKLLRHTAESQKRIRSFCVHLKRNKGACRDKAVSYERI